MLQDAMTAPLPAEELKPSRLLFSSYGFRIPIIREKFAKVIPQNDLQNKICVVIPYAGFNEEQTFLREKQALEEFGFSSENVLFLKSRADLILQTPDYIYVPGGNPFKLLNTLREKELLKPIAHCVKKQNAVYIGVSAGADLATENIKYVTLLEDNNEIHSKNFAALGLIDKSILCHSDRRTYSQRKLCEKASGREMLTVREDQLLTFYDNHWSYVGEEE